MNSLTLGTKVQRKGSKVVWTVDGHSNMGLAEGQTYPCIPAKDLGIDGATELHLRCQPKNRSIPMSLWLDIENFNKNWREASA